MFLDSVLFPQFFSFFLSCLNICSYALHFLVSLLVSLYSVLFPFLPSLLSQNIHTIPGLNISQLQCVVVINLCFWSQYLNTIQIFLSRLSQEATMLFPLEQNPA